MDVLDRDDAVASDRGVGEAHAVALDREQRIARDQVQALVDVGKPGGVGEPTEVALRLLDADDVRLGGPDRLGDPAEVDRDPAVPDVEAHHPQLDRARRRLGRRLAVVTAAAGGDDREA